MAIFDLKFGFYPSKSSPETPPEVWDPYLLQESSQKSFGEKHFTKTWPAVNGKRRFANTFRYLEQLSCIWSKNARHNSKSNRYWPLVAALGLLLAALGALLAALWPLLAALWPLLAALGPLLAGLGVLLGTIGPLLGALVPLLARSWNDMQNPSKSRCQK